MKVLTSILTKGWITDWADSDFEAFGQLSDLDQRCYRFIDEKRLPVKTQRCVEITPSGNLVIKTRVVRWMFRGNKFFVQAGRPTVHATICASGKVMGDPATAASIITNMLGYDMLVGTTSKELIALVTGGYDAYLKEGEKSKLMRDAHKHGLKYSALRYVTTNVEYFIDLLNKTNDREIADLLNQAVTLNRVVKHTWSRRRLHDMHQKWTREIAALQTRDASDDLIWDPIPELPSNVTLINSEKDACIEGIMMSHCLGTNYRGRIRYKSYIAFHVKDINGDYTVGISAINGECKFDQARRKCNNQCSESQLQFARSLVQVAQAMCNKLEQNDSHLPF